MKDNKEEHNMSLEEVKQIFKRRIKDCIQIAEESYAKRDHNSQSFNDYYMGKSDGFKEALSIIGMLHNDHNRVKNFQNQ